ncbi:MAG: 50S ribosomal protein L32 [Planctomycetota bacterium]
MSGCFLFNFHLTRSHHRLKAANYTTCKKCGQAKLPHAACQNCGYLNPKITLKLGE